MENKKEMEIEEVSRNLKIAKMLKSEYAKLLNGINRDFEKPEELEKQFNEYWVRLFSWNVDNRKYIATLKEYNAKYMDALETKMTANILKSWLVAYKEGEKPKEKVQTVFRELSLEFFEYEKVLKDVASELEKELEYLKNNDLNLN